ncbi:MAG TPA: hypothetical protein PKD73_09110, partial [Burkholderiaceae bacterium]|nr:hypothetical protein [Burkholderiaceae bacterium]
MLISKPLTPWRQFRGKSLGVFVAQLSSHRQLGVKPNPTIPGIGPRPGALARRATARTTGDTMQTTFPRLLLQHAALRGAAPAMREKEYG